jgi:hypothetical protein
VIHQSYCRSSMSVVVEQTTVNICRIEILNTCCLPPAWTTRLPVMRPPGVPSLVVIIFRYPDAFKSSESDRARSGDAARQSGCQPRAGVLAEVISQKVASWR